MKDINYIVQDWVGRDVFVEGVIPLPTGNGQVAYSPAIGKLVTVFTDGYAILEKNNKEPSMFFRANLRSINLVPEQSGIITPTKRIVTG